MNKVKDNTRFTRRKFLKGVGSGIAGVYVFPSLKTEAAKLPKEIRDSLEGKQEINVTVNGKKIQTKIDPAKTLAEFLRGDLDLKGTKIVCNHGECGGCTVVLNGEAVYSCQMLALDSDGGEVLTIEGLAEGEKLHPIQEAFIEKDGLQCGFCTPGQIMAAYALLKKTPHPTEEEIKTGMSGNLCRCSAYPKIIESVKSAAESIK